MVGADAQQDVPVASGLRQADHARDAQAFQVRRDERTGLEVVPQPDDHGSEGSAIDVLERIFNGCVQRNCRSNVVGDNAQELL